MSAGRTRSSTPGASRCSIASNGGSSRIIPESTTLKLNVRGPVRDVIVKKFSAREPDR